MSSGMYSTTPLRWSAVNCFRFSHTSSSLRHPSFGAQLPASYRGRTSAGTSGGSPCPQSEASSGSLTTTPCPPVSGQRVRREADRKSTRLNSSHVKISYAVFCLKKKKKNPLKNSDETEISRPQ